MKRTVVCISAFLSCIFAVQGRDCLSDSTSVWSRGGMPVMSLAEPAARGGSLEAGGRFLSGNAHLAQDNASESGLAIRADGGRTVGKLRLQGTFSFAQDWLKGRSYADQFNPLSSNPFKLASEIPGDYTRQTFAFSAEAASWILADRLAFGLGGDYMVGDLSRSNDPRSRSQILDLHLTPSLLWKINARNSLSAAFLYGYSREKMLTLNSRAEALDKYKYYELLGVGEYVPVGVIGFSRRYSGHLWGGGLQYNYASARFNAGVWVNYSSRTTNIRGETGESPGDYTLARLEAGSVLSFRGDSFLNQLELQFAMDDGGSNRFVQEKRIVTNDQGRVEMYWETLLEMPYYNCSGFSAEGRWTIRPAGGSSSWWTGVSASWTSKTSETLQPASSFSFSRFGASALAGTSVHFSRGRALELSGSAGAVLSLGVNNDENPKLESEGKTLLLDGVLRPDAELLRRNALTLSADIEYIFPATGMLFGIFVDAACLHTFSVSGSRQLLQAGLKLYY